MPHREHPPVRPLDAPWVAVADIGRSLDFYLDLDCQVRAAADGWAMLCCGEAAFVLIGQAAVAASSDGQLLGSGSTMLSPLVRLPTPDIRALRRRLLAVGVPAGTITRPCHAPAGEIEVTDPDRNLVVIAQPGPVPGHRPRRPPLVRARSQVV